MSGLRLMVSRASEEGETVFLTRAVPTQLLLGLVLGESALMVSASVLSDQWAPVQEEIEPSKGVFLVANPGLPDPRFRRTVVLLLAHGEDGTMGLIVNKATDIPVSEVLPGLDGSRHKSHVLFFGGPVALNGIIFLTRSGTPPKGTSHVMEDVYFSGDRKVLQHLLGEKKCADELRLYGGHSGWAPGQLDSEIERGNWRLVRADAYTVFERNPNTAWRYFIEPSVLPPIVIVQRGQELQSVHLAQKSVFFSGTKGPRARSLSE